MLELMHHYSPIKQTYWENKKATLHFSPSVDLIEPCSFYDQAFLQLCDFEVHKQRR